jgi:L-2-hydroxyglutarate oxidase LhgO
VLHSGIYYRPGSLRARNCRTGRLAMVRFCEEQEIPFEICGKVIVAVSDEELPRLENIFARGQQNEVRCEMIGPERLRELEPHAAGVRAIHVPDAGIADFRRVCLRLGDIVAERGGTICCDTRVVGMRQQDERVVIETTQGTCEVRYVINCTGLHSDRVTRLSGQPPEAQVVPFRGEFYLLKPEREHLCRNLIYPVPDPAFPFLGVHFTRMIGGGVECGPNAVLAFAREGYRKWDVNLRDLAEALTYPGFLRLAARHWRMGAGEMWRSFSKAAFVKALQRLLPAVQSDDLTAARAGVRAQAVGPDGAMIDDFVVRRCGRVINVANAPSPAATSSLNIAKLIVEQLSAALA